MIEDMAVDMRSTRWSAIGGRVLPPAAASAAGNVQALRHRPQRKLQGYVSLATSDGLLGPGRRLRYRRVDRYLTRLAVPMKSYGGGGATRSYHRPLGAYVNGLAACGLLVPA